MNVKDLFASLSGPHWGYISALEFDRCPRCADVRPVVQISAISTEAELLRHYAFHAAARKILVKKNLRVAQQLADPAKRLEILKYTVDHKDPGSADLHVEIAKLAQVSGNDAMLRSRLLQRLNPTWVRKAHPENSHRLEMTNGAYGTRQISFCHASILFRAIGN